jgi:L-threonylcarbamoyladenylate synthase
MEILRLRQGNSEEIIKKAVKYIRQGKVLILPTDTVYGLMADAANKGAVERIFKIKNRPKEKPLPVFVKDLKSAEKIAKIDEKQKKFLKTAWPGKITAVLKRKKKMKIFGMDKETIAIRIPKHKLMNETLRKLHRPVNQTSVNVSNKPPIIRIKEIIKHFQGRKYQPDLIIDAGNLPKSKPSKIVDLTLGKIKILRK